MGLDPQGRTDVDGVGETRTRDAASRRGGGSSEHPGRDGGEPGTPFHAGTRRSSPPLRRLLIGADTLSLALGWGVAAAVLTHLDAGVPLATLVLVGLAMLPVGLLVFSSSGLYRRQLCVVRSREVGRTLLSVAALNCLSVLLLAPYGLVAAITGAAVASISWGALLVAERGLFREWIQLRRAGGDFGAPVVVIGGTTSSVDRTVDLLVDNPYLGFDVRDALVGNDARRPVDDLHALADRLRTAGASGVVLDAASLTGDQLNEAVRDVSTAGFHVHVCSGLVGVDRRRITVSPFADETFLHVAPLSLTRHQLLIKRGIDVVIGTASLLLATPVLLAAAVAIRLDDGGPIIFRQERVGHVGARFTLYKLRTMTTDAEQRLDQLHERNLRDGPLFKASRDPRITRVGRFLRATSIDELPQLCNVLAGTMSLVGPRPALPQEAGRFDDQLATRLNVRPGVTGLWQVEARDLPSFDLYRRYDLLYVQNWSPWTDLALIFRTGAVVLFRGLRVLLHPRSEVLE